MRRTLPTVLRRVAAGLVAVACFGPGMPPAVERTASAEGAVLNGLMAPELTFPAGMNGIERGATLSSFRGRVVWLKFWLRDCPRCRATLPQVERFHRLYGKSGLMVLTVVHQYPPEQVKPFLDQMHYTFPVASDPSGTLAATYQVNHRPTDYVIGIDGRVKESNAAPEEVIFSELERYRVKELGDVPTGLDGVREKVKAWDYGSALKQALAAAAAAEAAPEVKQFAARFQALATQKLEDEIERGNVFRDLKDAAKAREAFETLARSYADTPLATRAKQARDAFVEAAGG